MEPRPFYRAHQHPVEIDDHLHENEDKMVKEEVHQRSRKEFKLTGTKERLYQHVTFVFNQIILKF